MFKFKRSASVQSIELLRERPPRRLTPVWLKLAAAFLALMQGLLAEQVLEHIPQEYKHPVLYAVWGLWFVYFVIVNLLDHIDFKNGYY